jgi:aromatic ring-opening dioxygenase LigB subunit
MALVFSGIVPHSPLLLPTVGKEARPLLQKTLDAIKKLEQELIAAKPETILIITPHGEQLSDAMIMNLNPEYGCDFSEFGDLTTKCRWRSDVMLIDRIREDFKTKHLPLVLDSNPFVSYGAAVPLSLLTAKLPQVKIVPLLTSGLEARDHFNFGKELKDEIMSSTAPIAVICSADLSPRVSQESPEGFSPRGVAFDEKVLDACNKSEPLQLLDIDAAWAGEAKACGYKPLALFAGMMHDVKHECVVLAYEKPLGVGYLTAYSKMQ